MRNRFLLAALTLVAVLPTLAMAQAMTPQREGSWEFSLGGGVHYLDGDLATFLGSKGFADNGQGVSITPSRLMPAAAVRLGYNFNNNWGFSIGTGYAFGDGVKYLIPLAALTYTVDLNATTSPFITAGTQFTRITGNGRVTHPTWGFHAGLGVRHMISDNVALRLEGRMGFERYGEIPAPARSAAHNAIITLGISYFTDGPRAAAVAPPCPVCGRARVDTVRINMQPPPPPPHRCEHGIAPAGYKVDAYGCLILRDTLTLEGVHFEFDKSDITPVARPILDRVGESMLAYPEAFFEIAGHTDSVGTFGYNFLLSARRAAAVRDYLISRGVSPGRMTAVGYGLGFPIAPNATVEGRALNRRGVQIRVLRP
jgi:outer membrane protein OmpA-like peptidoglycan-associated protein/opacity protein-like surface antigen